jgi:RND superfamily putative drug exporter
VLADAFVVRMLILPGLLHLLGPAAWWLPRWLDRILPHVDVEGAALRREHPVAPVAEPELVGAGAGPRG